MGLSESRVQVTPSRPLRNRHLSRVTDPRSPTTGVPRTPIEVGNASPKTPQLSPDEEVLDLPTVSDPRSPSQGIVRTPLRPPLHFNLNFLAKQLSEVFVGEDSVIEEIPSVNTEPAAANSEAQEDQVPSPAEQVVADASAVEEKVEDTEVPPEAAPDVAPVAAPVPAPISGVQQKPRVKSSHSSGAKNVRQRPKKPLHSSVAGRSPFKILQEDNSPNTAAPHRQVKKLSMQNDQSPSLRTVKISHNSWEICQNKENAHYGQSEG
ncbi:cell division cycle-associated protein 3 [Pelodytes ibericus]